jgi:predicted regulator of Ras-like GTPase activity (Roadblock/LC7/MglB family)
MFDKLIEEAVRDVGGHAAVLMGFDGIPVEIVTVEGDLDIETVGMEFSVLLKDVRKAAESLETGVTEELTVKTDRLSTVLRVINDEYFLAMAVPPRGNLGKARYLMRLLSPRLAADLV